MIFSLDDLGLDMDVDWNDSRFQVVPDVAISQLHQSSSLNPPEPLYSGIRSDPNSNSIVLRITFENVSFLFTGDAEAEVEADLTSSSYEVSATVLKVSHHGSKYSSTLDFLTAVGLEVAVISAGADNPYGHPAQETLDKLAVVGAEVYRTNLHGAIVVETDETTYMVTTEKQPSLPPTPTEEIMISYVHS